MPFLRLARRLGVEQALAQEEGGQAELPLVGGGKRDEPVVHVDAAYAAIARNAHDARQAVAVDRREDLGQRESREIAAVFEFRGRHGASHDRIRTAGKRERGLLP